MIYSVFNTEFREAFRKILVSYVRNECCDKEAQRQSRTPIGGHGAVSDPLVGVRPHYSLSDGSMVGHAVDQVPPPPSTPIPLNNQAISPPSIEVSQDKSIELSFYPHPTSKNNKNISAI